MDLGEALDPVTPAPTRAKEGGKELCGVRERERDFVRATGT